MRGHNRRKMDTICVVLVFILSSLIAFSGKIKYVIVLFMLTAASGNSKYCIQTLTRLSWIHYTDYWIM